MVLDYILAKDMSKKTTTNLSQEIFNILNGRINSWKYAPSHRFTEIGLSEEFGVSRSPIREALAKLVDKGLVEKIPNIGYSVRQPNMNEVVELYDLRLALELYVVEVLSINGLSKEKGDKLYDDWTTLLKSKTVNLASVADLDEQFHETLATEINNKALLKELQRIKERLHFIRMTDITTSDRLKTTCEQHIQILDCINLGDSICAREALQKNIKSGRDNVEYSLKSAIAQTYL